MIRYCLPCDIQTTEMRCFVCEQPTIDIKAKINLDKIKFDNARVRASR